MKLRRQIKKIFSALLTGILIAMTLTTFPADVVKAADGDGYIHAEQFKNLYVYDGVDVSEYNVKKNKDGTRRWIDWTKVKESGVDFALVRLAYCDWFQRELKPDLVGPENCKGAKAAGLKLGVYFRSQAITEAEAIEEAQYIINIMKKNNISVDLPVAIDYEYKDGPTGRLYDAHLTREQATNVCMAFCNEVFKQGYTPMVYANKSMLTNQLNADVISSKYTIWLAEWPKENKPKQATYNGTYTFWQYSSKGSVPGIEGAVDRDFFYSKDKMAGSMVPDSAQIVYKTHIQSKGWENQERYDGQTSGTVGSSRRLEAIEIRNNTGIQGSITYQVHCQSYAWKDWVCDGALAGTVGESKRLEAIRIKLTGELAEKYDIYYKVHLQTYGWLDWAKNGETAGSTGLGKRMEAIQIKLVEKNGAAPGATENTYKIPLLSYETHVQTYGWQNAVIDSTASGTTGQAKRLEAIRIKNISGIPGDILYRVHGQTYGWTQGWKKNGEMAGTVGSAKRLEAIQIQLSGQLAEKYDVYYRVHAQSYGWLDWAKNGEPAGTAGKAKRLEAIQIMLVSKGGKAPGAVSCPYIGPTVR